ncbi:condensation domain-containing protein [Rhodococcus sp. P1Y]|uniref:condensation domain-containing protein n=1 Tax=Rhodococcus sp. P1Y TaxID=1302308 RepID=UPI000EABE7C9|nr:condensation domain-containing protein [Rhodococcus sp. P1Y]AYJ48548.1 acyltransferase [Rhodococcus sp. P1Y]
MVSFGLIGDWKPEPGLVTTWKPSADTIARVHAAPPHPVPASHIQEEYLKSAYRNRDSGFRFSRLCLVTFDIFEPLDSEAMTQAVNAFVRRHDTFASWFDVDDDGVERHVTDVETIELVPTEHGRFDDQESLREHVQNTTPGPTSWDCFSFGVVDRGSEFTVYAAVDHLDTDGISQALTVFELRWLYLDAAKGALDAGPCLGSYLEYCRREREASSVLTLESPEIRQWIDLVRSNGGDLPSFALPLGAGTEKYTRSEVTMLPLFDHDEAQKFDEACERIGAKFTGGIFAAAAIAEYELTGQESYLGLTPKSTRSTPGEFGAIGWFSSLVPVHFAVGGALAFSHLAGSAQRAFETGKLLADVSYHRVLELITPESGITTQPGWSAPMISYVDVRKLPGADVVSSINGGLFGNQGSSDEVYMWINRFEEQTGITFMYPGTDTARESIRRYYDKISEIFLSVARTGEYSFAESVAGRTA